ncbi:hypothetical protein [uncultured Croceitalea sp.]|uniref:hypothetical protein n=1 Tax=uncultured Croceitalea sp. TaxID=1798908 RepID=UPI003305C9AC
MNRYSVLFLCFPFFFLNAQKTIDFTLDASAIPNPTNKKLNIGLRGSMAPLSWVRGLKLRDEDHDGVYKVKAHFDNMNQDTLYFKYVLNEVEWEEGDAIAIKLDSDKTTEHSTVFRYHKPTENVFKKFIGEWTLKNDTWYAANTPKAIDTLYLPNHRTICKELNTKRSLLWVVDATSAKGHGLWTYNQATQSVVMQSSFYENRIGLGSGSIDENGNVTLTMVFEGSEPEGTYRKYSYDWVDENTYILTSYQYDSANKPTGSFYGGTFVRTNTK